MPDLWDAFSGLYPCKDGFVRIHANFKHHRDGALRLLGLDPGNAKREDAQAALMSWNAIEFESAMAEAKLVATAPETRHSGFGELKALCHSAQIQRTPARWLRAAMPPGIDAGRWD